MVKGDYNQMECELNENLMILTLGEHLCGQNLVHFVQKIRLALSSITLNSLLKLERTGQLRRAQ